MPHPVFIAQNQAPNSPRPFLDLPAGISQDPVPVGGARRERGRGRPGTSPPRPGDGAGSVPAAAPPDPPRELGYPSPGTRRGLAARPGGGGFPSPGRPAFPPALRSSAGRATRRRLPATGRARRSRAGSSVSRLRLWPGSAAAPGPSGVAGALGLAGARGSGIARAGRGGRYQSPGPGSRR